jgi:hypothetical protein
MPAWWKVLLKHQKSRIPTLMVEVVAIPHAEADLPIVPNLWMLHLRWTSADDLQPVMNKDDDDMAVLMGIAIMTTQRLWRNPLLFPPLVWMYKRNHKAPGTHRGSWLCMVMKRKMSGRKV